MKKEVAIFLALVWFCLGSLTHAQNLGAPNGVATWSVQTNTAAWNQALGVKYTRQGCSDTPANCVAFVKGVSTANNVKVTLAIALNTSTTASYATQYSQLSKTSPFLIEVSIDDFVDQYRALFTGANANPAALVAQVIANLKSANPNLRFGATIYEDDLASPYLQNAKLPAAVRNGFDYIHLFLHYRGDGPNFPGYVQKAKSLFPKARIVAGSYAYDRRAYISCIPNGPACTAQQDSSLFQQALAAQTQEMKQGIVDHVEFYPGYFGEEAQWTGWSNPRNCAPGDLTECLANTVAMREAAASILSATTGTPLWNELSPTGQLAAARYAQSVAMDSWNHRMIVFGGFSATASLNDTWILTNADGKHGQPAWIPLPTSNAPPATFYSNGMYDPGTNRMMIFGGNSGTEVWVLTNANGLGTGAATWIQLSPGGAPPNFLNGWESQVYDPVRNAMIVYDSSAGMWVLSHANGTGGTPVWAPLSTPAGGPSVRAGFTAVYNAAKNQMIVFGGSDGTTDFNDLWVLINANGIGGAQAWIPLPTGTATVPAGREGHSAVYDSVNDAMTIFGGIGMPAESWTATNASGLTGPPVWNLANPGTGLDTCTDCSVVLDTGSLSMIVFGGYTSVYLNSTFVLSPVM